MQNAEIELKLPIHDLAQLQSQLPALGFQLDTPRTFEQNTLYDTAARALRASRQILRIRRYGDVWTVTHKRPEPFPADAGAEPPATRYKVRIETETIVQDGPTLGTVFEQLGYLPVFRYEKFRTEWSQAASFGGPVFSREFSVALPPPLPRCHLVIDETPIGDFAELEGPPAWIDATLDRLGVDPASSITDSYGRLFLAWKERTGSLAENLTFDEIPAGAEIFQPTF
ncbi:MAG TPA: class IV adenylate cyclase [Acidobacteriaceae bacterium]|nr:class IV adenylate cyclase [Acidobacteriaceae bacterium]